MGGRARPGAAIARLDQSGVPALAHCTTHPRPWRTKTTQRPRRILPRLRLQHQQRTRRSLRQRKQTLLHQHLPTGQNSSSAHAPSSPRPKSDTKTRLRSGGSSWRRASRTQRLKGYCTKWCVARLAPHNLSLSVVSLPSATAPALASTPDISPAATLESTVSAPERLPCVYMDSWKLRRTATRLLRTPFYLLSHTLVLMPCTEVCLPEDCADVPGTSIS